MQATTLFDRPGFYIYGPAILGVTVKPWHCLRVNGEKQSVEAKLAHLTLGDHAVVPTCRQDITQDVIVRDENDFLMVKMALS